jgi:hypothetical protein
MAAFPLCTQPLNLFLLQMLSQCQVLVGQDRLLELRLGLGLPMELVLLPLELLHQPRLMGRLLGEV